MIDKWLNDFEAAWVSKNIDQVLSLFSADVEYWETPYQRLENIKSLKLEWNAITKQQNIHLNLRVFSSLGNKHTVMWNLSYVNESLLPQEWAGVYLIELDQTGKCSYFYQTGQKR